MEGGLSMTTKAVSPATAAWSSVRGRRLVLLAFSIEEVKAPREPPVELRGRSAFDCGSPREAAHVKVDRVLSKPRLVPPMRSEPAGALEKSPARTVFYAQGYNPL